jgi:hypothetical protein
MCNCQPLLSLHITKAAFFAALTLLLMPSMGASPFLRYRQLLARGKRDREIRNGNAQFNNFAFFCL